MKPVLKLYVSKSVLVFDSHLWAQNGGDSKTDDFYREAKIISLFSNNNSADVLFKHSGRFSEGHFTDSFKELPYERNKEELLKQVGKDIKKNDTKNAIKGAKSWVKTNLK